MGGEGGLADRSTRSAGRSYDSNGVLVRSRWRFGQGGLVGGVGDEGGRFSGSQYEVRQK